MHTIPTRSSLIACRATSLLGLACLGTLTAGALNLIGLPFAINPAWLACVAIGLVACLAFIGPRVGYRWFDIAQLMVPVYGIGYCARILYRGLLLDEFDEVPETPTEAYRTVVVAQLVGSGIDRATANASAYCLYPLDDEVEAQADLADQLISGAKQFAHASRGLGGDALNELVRTSLSTIARAAEAAQDEYYKARAEAVLEALQTAQISAADRFGKAWALTVDDDAITQPAESRKV